MSFREKRRATDKKANSSLAQLRELRRSGGSRIAQYEAEEAEDIYEVVDDERLFKRLKEDHDDFVEDDDGSGYVDDGQDEREYYSDEVYGEESSSKRNGKGKHPTRDAPKPKAKENIRDAFMKAESRPKVARPAAQKERPADDDFLSSLLQGIDQPIPTTPTKKLPPGPSRRAPLVTPTRSLIKKMGPLKIEDDDHDRPLRNSTSSARPAYDDDPFEIGDHDDFDDFAGPLSPEPEVTIKEEEDIVIRKEPMRNPFQIDDEPIMPLNVKPIVAKDSKTPMRFVNDSSVKAKATVIKQSEDEKRQNWMAVEQTMNQAYIDTKETEAVMDIQESSVLEDDGTLKMYWIDACEVKGVVYLFGKALQKTTNKFVSCAVAVHNLERSLFILPRKYRVDMNGNETSAEVSMHDVYNEFDKIRQSYKISLWAGKAVERNYAFDLPGVPSTAEYFNALYSYTMPALPSDLKGETFSHIFGTNTSALELFIISQKLMGPSWLEIKNPKPNAAKISWCKTEFSVGDAEHITPLPESPELPPPPLCVMSLSLRTIINPKDKSNEVVSACSSIYNEVRPDDSVENNRKNVSKQMLIRKLPTSPFPPGFDRVAEKSPVKITKLSSERALLNLLLARIISADPDVIVGHNFVGFDLDVLLHRMKFTKADHWSRIGRLRRTIWPKLQSGAGGMGDTTAAEKHVMAGRLMCDTYLGAKEHVRSKSYSLTQLVAMQLDISREDIDYERVSHYFNSADDLERMLRHSDFDTYLCMELMFSLQLLPLSRQLTTLSGNLWSMTLTAGRAVRNEYLLLHEFYNCNYICPDKSFFNKDDNKEPIPLGDMDDQDDGAGAGAIAGPSKKGRRKPQYSGGLVLEPKKGFYDQYVLLLDFNSLYPSIIQEYNICFTTVKLDATKDEDNLPENPSDDVAQGILPRLLANLVERRREVKKLMKSATGAKYAEYDIRQKGLKLTANSMYGCLGAAYSRFYAKPLAMLITSKGREILQNTVDLATENGLDVIYGDTDSIMINTNTRHQEEVRPIADGFKKIINGRYRLLEIEMDGMYQRMLLLKKKKYAALAVMEKNGKLETIVETKGLDMVRRDWCGLSQDVSSYVLDQILSRDNHDREQVVENIHSYLRTVAEETRNGLIPIDKFVVNKGLTKAPEEYADAKTQPHVQVALRMKQKGISVRAGDTVPYVICVHEDSPTPKGSYADRAYHPDEVLQPNSNLTIDFEYYLNQQVHPPLDRLCGPIEGTDATRLAECLGLDTSKFRSAVRPGGQDEELKTLGSQLSDAERYKDAESLQLRCRACQSTFACSGLLMEENSASRFGLQCPNCQTIVATASASVQLTCAIRKHIQNFYQGWVVCDDQSCRNKTRMVSVVGRRCLVEGCRGIMHNEYSDSALYTQLSFFSHIFDANKALQKIDFDKNGDIRVRVEENRELIRHLRACADRYVDKNSRRFVDLTQLFSFVKITSR